MKKSLLYLVKLNNIFDNIVMEKSLQYLEKLNYIFDSIIMSTQENLNSSHFLSQKQALYVLLRRKQFARFLEWFKVIPPKKSYRTIVYKLSLNVGCQYLFRKMQ